MKLLFLSAGLALFTGAASADIRYLESGIGVTFEGCDHEKIINLENG